MHITMHNEIGGPLKDELGLQFHYDIRACRI